MLYQHLYVKKCPWVEGQVRRQGFLTYDGRGQNWVCANHNIVYQLSTHPPSRGVICSKMSSLELSYNPRDGIDSLEVTFA